MKIISGLFDHMVLQRNRRGWCDSPVSGECDATKGELFIRVREGDRRWRKVARLKNGAFKFRLMGLPSGGPYQLELQLRRGRDVIESLEVIDVMVGDVWLCAGQSNMQGCGHIKWAEKPMTSVRAFYMDDRWGVAKDPIHNLWDCIDQIHIDFRGGRPPVDTLTGVGPAVAFGHEMALRTGVPQGLIACSHGGTSMADWSPSLKELGGKSFYGATHRRLSKNGGRAAGVIWYQGECDASSSKTAASYSESMKFLVEALRRDACAPRLPFCLVQLGRVANGTIDPLCWKSIQEQQRLLPHSIAKLAVVSAIDLELEDAIHIAGEHSRRLGRRLAAAMQYLQSQNRGGSGSIDLRSVNAEYDPVHRRTTIAVHFDHVTGALRADGRPAGFSIADSSGVLSYLFSTRLEGSKVILQSHAPLEALSGLFLYYGYGNDPYCNIRDEADRALPVLGPILIRRSAITPYARLWQVTRMLPGAGRLCDLRFPEERNGLPWRIIHFPTHICNVHGEFLAENGNDKLMFFRCSVEVSEKMELHLIFGYDGPVKLWIDGKEVLHDPDGKPPLTLDRRRIPWRPGPGEYEIMVALGSNCGQTWGISLCIERLGISHHLPPKESALPCFIGS
jgi:hypothetical protein